MQNDAISKGAAIDIINEERRFIESLRETAYDNEDRAHNTGELGCAIRLARKIKELPALDVVPVVHARWIRDDLGNTRCSNCHTRLPFRHCYDEEDGYEWDDEIDETPWCSYCGARMDGETDG